MNLLRHHTAENHTQTSVHFPDLMRTASEPKVHASMMKRARPIPTIAHTLQRVPEVVPRSHSSVQKLIKVLVVAEDHMAAHVKEEPFWSDICACQATSLISLHYSKNQRLH